METIELRVGLTEELVRELLWRTLAPEGIVMTSALSGAIAEQAALRDMSLEAYQLSGISVTIDAGVMHAELSYTPRGNAGARA